VFSFTDRFIECFIAEQNMLGVGMGCATRDRTVAFASAFACFLSRGYDQIRMGAISQTKLKMAGSHVGVSIGKLWFPYFVFLPSQWVKSPKTLKERVFVNSALKI